MAMQRRRFSKEFKQEAVPMATGADRSISWFLLLAIFGEI